MPRQADPELLRRALLDGNEQGFRLEIIDGLGVWEVMPTKRHIKAASRIERSVRQHSAAKGIDRFQSPVDIALACGCVVTV
jgi:hypothetical protein